MVPGPFEERASLHFGPHPEHIVYMLYRLQFSRRGTLVGVFRLTLEMIFGMYLAFLQSFESLPVRFQMSCNS